MASGSYFSLGLNTYKVPMSLHANNRARLIARFQTPDVPSNSVILLQGGESENKYCTDGEKLFRQESYFQYLFGVKEPDCYGLIDVAAKKSVLFIPRLPAEYAVWMGTIQPPEHFQKVYEVEEVQFVDELDGYLASKADLGVVYVLHGLNSDSGNYSKPATFPGIQKYRVDNGRLHPELAELRVIKSPQELDLMRYVTAISSQAHTEVMKYVRPGMTEYQLESMFLHTAYTKGGCRNMSYICICGTGENGAVLHYGHAGAPNDKLIRDGDMCLMDMGAEYHCYCSDITCCYPANGKFTQAQKDVYETVLAAHDAVLAAMKPGVLWPEMHRLAERTILAELARRGFLRGNVDDMVAVNLAAVFQPHGLGHLLGLDTHDVGGYPKGVQRINEPGVKKLRTARALLEGMVITVEPGVYFIQILLDEAANSPTHSKFLNMDKINEFRNFGGVRIESDVIVTATGAENMTKVPRTVADIEAVMAEARANAH